MESIEKAFVQALETLKEERLQEYDEMPRRDPGDRADWSKENACINSIGFEFLKNYGTLELGMSLLNNNYHGYREQHTISSPLVCHSIDEFKHLLDNLKKMVEKFVTNDSEYLFAPAIKIDLNVYVNNTEEYAMTILKNKGYEDYVQSLRDFWTGIMNDNKSFKDIKYFYFSSELFGLVNLVDEFSYKELIQFINKVYDMSQSEARGDSIRFKVEVFLQYTLCGSINKKRGNRKLTEEEQDIFNYTGDYLLKRGEKNEAKAIYAISAESGNEAAREKLGRKKKAGARKKSKKDLLKEILHTYIEVVSNNKAIEDVCPEEFMDDFRSVDEAIAVNAIKYPELHPLMRQAIEAIITATGKGTSKMWEDDQEQTGGAIARELALHNKEDIELYARYVATNDMDHPVYQYDDMEAVIEKWGIGKDTYPIMAINGLVNPGQHGDEFIDEYKDQLLELFKNTDEADAFIRACARAGIEGWNAYYPVERRTETVDILFSELFDTPYHEDYKRTKDFKHGDQYAASARGFITAVTKGEYPTYEYLISLEKEKH